VGRCGLEKVAHDGIFELDLGRVEDHEVIEALLTRLGFLRRQVRIRSHLASVEK